MQLTHDEYNRLCEIEMLVIQGKFLVFEAQREDIKAVLNAAREKLDELIKEMKE